MFAAPSCCDRLKAGFSEARIGGRLWIELSAAEVAEQKYAIFQAIYNVQFDTAALRVIGDSAALKDLGKIFWREFTDDGFTRFGGFTDSFEPQRGRIATARFQVEVTQAVTYQIDAPPGPHLPSRWRLGLPFSASSSSLPCFVSKRYDLYRRS